MACPLPEQSSEDSGSLPAAVRDPASPAQHRPRAQSEAPFSFASREPGGPIPGARKILLFFIDGIGVGEDDPDVNYLATGEFPALELTKTRTPIAPVGPPNLAYGLDASLGVEGLPQSATGQTTILTGVNAPAVMGRHISGLPGPTLRAILGKHSILKRVRESGRSASFLNAFGPRFFDTPPEKRRLSATTLATLASGAPIRTWTDLLEGRAVVHDLTHWRMREWGYELPARTPEEAGAIIAEQCEAQHFSLFEYFETDRAGHDQDRARALRCLGDLNRALETVLARVDLRETMVLVVSDHGNLEDARVKRHTRNPAFFALWGAYVPRARPRALTDIAGLIEEALGLAGTETGTPPVATEGA